MNIAILGGAFNPPHWGHLSIARQTLDFCPVDQVWLMPTHSYDPLFNKKLASFKHRLAMVKLLKHPKIKVSDFEKNISGVSHTYKVIKVLQKHYPKVNFSFLMGSDNLAQFHQWYRYKDLLKLLKFYIFPRENKHLKLSHPEMELIRSPLLKSSLISSTYVRKAMQKGKNTKTLIPPKIKEYICKNKLLPKE